MELYHGSTSRIDRFDYDKIGQSNGTDEGYGFYLIDRKDIAERFADKGYLNICKIDPILAVNDPNLFGSNQSISTTKITFSIIALKMLINKVEEYEEGCILYNYGDPSRVSRNALVMTAARNELEYNSNDVDILCSLSNGCGSKEYVLRAFVELFGQNCLKITENKYTENESPTDIYLVFDADAITITESVFIQENEVLGF